MKEPTFIKLNDTDGKKSDPTDKYESKLFNEIFKKEIKLEDKAILYITFLKYACESCLYFNVKAECAVDENKPNTAIIAVSMENMQEDYDKMMKKYPFFFIQFERRDLRDELVNRFNINRVPCILAFQIYYDDDRYRASILNGGDNIIPRLK